MSPIGIFVAIFSEDRSGVLLVQHSYNSHEWSLPGGGLDPGETVIGGGIRETEEETGLIPAISDKTLVGVFSLRKSLGVVFLFVGTIAGGKLNGSTDETIGAKFIRFDELCGYPVYPAQRAFIERARIWRVGDPIIFDYPSPTILPRENC